MMKHLALLSLCGLLTSCATTLENHEGAPVTPPPPMAEEGKPTAAPVADTAKPEGASPGQLAAPVDLTPPATTSSSTPSAVPNLTGLPPPAAPIEKNTSAPQVSKPGWEVADPIAAKVQGKASSKKVIPTSQEIDQAFEKHLAEEDLKGRKTLREEEMLFPHETGNKQVELGFNAGSFGSLNWNKNRDSKGRQSLGTTRSSTGATLSFLFYPIQFGLGKVGLGPTGSMYWTKFTNEFRDSIYTYGFKAEYEALFMRGQMLVPHVFYTIDKMNVKGYKLSSDNGDDIYDGSSFTSQSYGGGVHFNLNRLEPDTVSKAYANIGIRKYYLTYSYQMRARSIQLGDLGGGHLVSFKFEY